MANVKVKATHTIVHNGQTLQPGTIFEADTNLVKELTAAGAIEQVEGTDVVPVKLAPAPNADKIAADKAALAAAQAQLTADGGDGLGSTTTAKK